MGEVRRSLRRVFAREIDRARAGPPSAAVRRGWAVRPGTPGRRGMAEGSAPPPGPGSRLRSQGPSRSRRRSGGRRGQVATSRRQGPRDPETEPIAPGAASEAPCRRSGLDGTFPCRPCALLVSSWWSSAPRRAAPGGLRETTILIRLPCDRSVRAGRSRPLREAPSHLPYPQPPDGDPPQGPGGATRGGRSAPEVGTATPRTPAPPSRQPGRPTAPAPMGPWAWDPAPALPPRGVTEGRGVLPQPGPERPGLGVTGVAPKRKMARPAGTPLARQHQDEDGGWSLEGYQRHLRARRPPGRGIATFDVGATASRHSPSWARAPPPRSSSAARRSPAAPARGGARPLPRARGVPSRAPSPRRSRGRSRTSSATRTIRAGSVSWERTTCTTMPSPPSPSARPWR